jgi:hypothetical protein
MLCLLSLGEDMQRREFITLLGGAAAAWPFAARAQQQGGRLPTIGFLGTGTASGWQPWMATFVQRLRTLGWSEGRTVALEYRWGEGRRDRFAEIAAEFVRMKVDIIVSGVQKLPDIRRIFLTRRPLPSAPILAIPAAHATTKHLPQNHHDAAVKRLAEAGVDAACAVRSNRRHQGCGRDRSLTSNC